MWPDGFPAADYIRQVRRRRRLSQRALAAELEVPHTTISRFESGKRLPGLMTMQRILAVADLTLLVVDEDVRFVSPLVEFGGACSDGAGRRYPAHLDVIVDPVDGEWWGDVYGLYRPPETFVRDPTLRAAERDLSRWNTRYEGPSPAWPNAVVRAVQRKQGRAHRRPGSDRRGGPDAGVGSGGGVDSVGE